MEFAKNCVDYPHGAFFSAKSGTYQEFFQRRSPEHHCSRISVCAGSSTTGFRLCCPISCHGGVSAHRRRSSLLTNRYIDRRCRGRLSRLYRDRPVSLETRNRLLGILAITGEVGYQLERSLNALRWGGLFGVGIDESVAKINYLPYPHTDFIFAVLAEEFGFIGTSSVTLIFMIFVWRGISIAMRIENRFGALFATGLTVVIGLQAFINIGVVTGLLPTKGITLPFLSYGGSSLVISLISVGMLLNISRHVQKTQH